MGHPDFRVRNKIFASLTPDQTRCALKCDPISLDALVRGDPESYSDAWRGRWLGIDLRRAGVRVVAGLLEDAWRLVAPKRLVLEHDRER